MCPLPRAILSILPGTSLPPVDEFVKCDRARVLAVGQAESQQLFVQRHAADKFVQQQAEFIPVYGTVPVPVVLVEDSLKIFQFFRLVLLISFVPWIRLWVNRILNHRSSGR